MVRLYMFKACMSNILVFCFMIITVIVPMSAAAVTPNAPTALKTENLVNPMGISGPNPRFSWINASSDRGWMQSAYRIIVASSLANINNNIGDKWDTGKVTSSAQSSIKYAGSTIAVKTKYWWKVLVYDQAGAVSAYSSAATFETGIFSAADWTVSQMIGGDYNLMRDDFILDSTKTIDNARVYIASLGYSEVYINGEKVGTDVLNPGYTEYDKNILYSTYDVKNLLTSSTNSIGIMLGSGYYGMLACPKLNLPFQKGAIMDITVKYTDGTSFHFGTNPIGWKALKGGPITYDDNYNGERYDATQELDFSSYGFNDSGWTTPTALNFTGTIAAQYSSIKVTEDVAPVSTTQVTGAGPSGYTLCALEGDTVNFSTPADVAYGVNGSYEFRTSQSGNVSFTTGWFNHDSAPDVHKLGFYKNTSGTIPTYIVDLGKDITGWVKISLSGPRGSKITLRYSESLKSDGNLETVDLRNAKATDTYILKGGGTETFEPRFTYHGFQYIEISGLSSSITLNSITGRAIRNDYSLNTFSTSNRSVNKILAGARGSVLNNSISVPTDCSNRDERSTSGGDAYLSSESNLLNFDMQTFYEKCMNDVDYAQKVTGEVPACFPSYNWDTMGDVAWASQRVLIPWNLYMATGDKNELAAHYAKMRQFVDYLASLAGPDFLDCPAGPGDWVPAGATESNVFFADAYFYRNAVLMAKIAGVLNNSSDVTKYNTLATNIKNAFNVRYLNSNSYYGNNTQSGNAIALDFDLVPAGYQVNVLNSLLNNVLSNNNHFTTGILGTKSVIEALWQNNRSDVVFDLLLQTTYPSFLDMMKTNGLCGEHWNPADYIGSGMNSMNHHMFGGGPGAWTVKAAVGISPLEPGYSKILIQPEVVGDLTSGNGTISTPKGQVSSSWTKVSGTQFNLNVTIPANSTAIVSIPTLGGTSSQIAEGGVTIYNGGFVSGRNGINSIQSTANGRIAFNVGSGTYSFVMTSM